MDLKAKATWGRLAVVVVLAFASFPGGLMIPASGLDPSWMWALNVLPHEGVVWGRDTTFTYGPLGFLVVPQHFAWNGWIALAFRIGLQALLGVSVFILLRDVPLRRAAVAVALLFASGVALYVDHDAYI